MEDKSHAITPVSRATLAFILVLSVSFVARAQQRPLLTEEGLGYYPLLKSQPLADIEDWQEDYLQAIEEAKAQLVAAGGPAPVLDEKALKI